MPNDETTQFINRSDVRNKAEILCHGQNLNEGCHKVLMHIASSLDVINTRLDRIDIKMAKGDPETSSKIAVMEDRVNMHSKLLGAAGVMIGVQALAILAQLLMQ